MFRGTAGIPLEQTNCSVYSVFRGIIFLSETANPISEAKLSENKISVFSGNKIKMLRAPHSFLQVMRSYFFLRVFTGTLSTGVRT
jgi:hypothetical protein